MKEIFILDTDILSYILKKKYTTELRKNLADHDPKDIKISVMTYCEISLGLKQSDLPPAMTSERMRFLEKIDILPITSAIGEIFTDIKNQLFRKGIPLEDFDLFIASTALAHGATLVTNNTKHFERIPGLKVENWTKDS